MVLKDENNHVYSFLVSIAMGMGTVQWNFTCPTPVHLLDMNDILNRIAGSISLSTQEPYPFLIS